MNNYTEGKRGKSPPAPEEPDTTGTDRVVKTWRLVRSGIRALVLGSQAGSLLANHEGLPPELALGVQALVAAGDLIAKWLTKRKR